MNDRLMNDRRMKVAVAYHLCPQCFRATPASTKERYCPNDGAALLTACPNCHALIPSPYSRFCSSCGQAFGKLARADIEDES